jgi:hypothetical protein
MSEDEKFMQVYASLFTTLPDKGMNSTSGSGLEFIMNTHTDEACGEAGDAPVVEGLLRSKKLDFLVFDSKGYLAKG